MRLASIRGSLIEFPVVALAAALCAGCGGGSADGGKGDPAELQPLTRIDAEQPGPNCAAGGSAVRTGLDRNGDGVLEDSEISSTSYVCAEAQRTLLVRTEPASPEACPAGGTAVLVGIDLDDDGVLEDGEVQRTTNACADAEPRVLTRSTPLLPGGGCAAGGSTVEAGHDRNRDGVLQDEEVEQRQVVCGSAVLSSSDRTWDAPGCAGSATRVRSGADVDGDGTLEDAEVQVTSYVCSDTVFGYEVRTQADLDFLRSRVSLVRGDLVIRSDTLTDVNIYGMAVTGAIRVVDSPALVGVYVTPLLLGGDVEIAREPALQHLDVGIGDIYGKLPIIGSLSVTDCPSLEWISLSDRMPSIQGSLRLVRSGVDYLWAEGVASIGGSLHLEETTRLRAVDLPALRTVGGDLNVWANVDLGKDHPWDDGLHGGGCIQTVGGEVSVADNVSLGWFELSCLLRAERIGIVRNAELTSFAFQRLEVVDSDIDVESNPKLTSTGWALPSPPPALAVGGTLRVTDNPALIQLSGIGYVTSVQQVIVARNDALRWLHLGQLGRADAVRVEDNAALAYIAPSGYSPPLSDELDALTHLAWVGELDVERNATLQKLQLPALWHADAVSVTDNPVLPRCQAQAVLDQLRQPPGTAQLTGNDDAAACP